MRKHLHVSYCQYFCFIIAQVFINNAEQPNFIAYLWVLVWAWICVCTHGGCVCVGGGLCARVQEHACVRVYYM